MEPRPARDKKQEKRPCRLVGRWGLLRESIVEELARVKRLLRELQDAVDAISSAREAPPEPFDWADAPAAREGRLTSADVVYHRLTADPWCFGHLKAWSCVESGISERDLDDWERYAHKHGRAAARKRIQMYRNPSQIPRDPAEKNHKPFIPEGSDRYDW